MMLHACKAEFVAMIFTGELSERTAFLDLFVTGCDHWLRDIGWQHRYPACLLAPATNGFREVPGYYVAYEWIHS